MTLRLRDTDRGWPNDKVTLSARTVDVSGHKFKVSEDVCRSTVLVFSVLALPSEPETGIPHCNSRRDGETGWYSQT